mmetsp:Transcript_7224/g.15275  ORF Transcript_7224/g.15275 Transcript_7224/m.15275 type:complete len:209 (-) Transcript_7224:16-642(-)
MSCCHYATRKNRGRRNYSRGSDPLAVASVVGNNPLPLVAIGEDDPVALPLSNHTTGPTLLAEIDGNLVRACLPVDLGRPPREHLLLAPRVAVASIHHHLRLVVEVILVDDFSWAHWVLRVSVVAHPLACSLECLRRRRGQGRGCACQAQQGLAPPRCRAAFLCRRHHEGSGQVAGTKSSGNSRCNRSRLAHGLSGHDEHSNCRSGLEA